MERDRNLKRMVRTMRTAVRFDYRTVIVAVKILVGIIRRFCNGCKNVSNASNFIRNLEASD